MTSPICNNPNYIWDVAQLLQGDSFQQLATYKHPDSLITAIEVTTAGDSTVAFMGTDDGSIIKVISIVQVYPDTFIRLRTFCNLFNFSGKNGLSPFE